MATMDNLVRSLANMGATIGSPLPMLRNIVRRKPVATPPPADFATLVEREIIPRLVMAHSDGPHDRLRDVDDGVDMSVEEISAFAPLALDHDAGVLVDRIDVFLRRGVPADRIMVEMLAPAARYLGEMWEDDQVDFVAVTMAMWRLQEVVREVSARVPVHGCGGREQSSALFSVLPGEQHSFGTVMIEDVFRRAGWNTELLTDCTVKELSAIVSAQSFDIIGLTVTGDVVAADTKSVIDKVRSASRNPDVTIMVGGRCFAGDVDRAKAVGADTTSNDAIHALEVANAIVERRRALGGLHV